MNGQTADSPGDRNEEAMEREHIYSFSGEKLKNVYTEGMELSRDRRSSYDRLMSYGDGVIILPYIDGGPGRFGWGRLHVSMELTPKAVYTVYVMSLPEAPADGSFPTRLSFLSSDAEVFVNKEDMLLYGAEGRYLSVMIAVSGEGLKAVGDIRIYAKGDFLMDMFPDVYRQRNSVFHRYLSVFSTVCQDMEEKIDRLPELLIPDKAPEHMLFTMAEWMGLDLRGDFLEEDTVRLLVSEAYMLNRKRGTREALSRMAQILTGERPVIIERNLMPAANDKERGELENRLYGSDIYDVTVIIVGGKKQYRHSQLLFLLNQMKPVRCRLKLICADKSSQLDSYTYLDINGSICGGVRYEAMDEGMEINKTKII